MLVRREPTGRISSPMATSSTRVDGGFDWYLAGADGEYLHGPSTTDLSVNADDFGYLYNGPVALDARGVCPTGWKVPSDDDWMMLEQHLGMDASDALNSGFRGYRRGRSIESPRDGCAELGRNEYGAILGTPCGVPIQLWIVRWHRRRSPLLEPDCFGQLIMDTRPGKRQSTNRKNTQIRRLWCIHSVPEVL